MSWIFGCYRFDGVEESEIPTIPEKLQKHSLFESSRIAIYSDTSSPIIYSSIDENSGTVISGIGINITDSQIYTGDSWAACESVERLDGQFVKAEWHADKLILSSDSVGLRKFYIFQPDENYLLFSTRLDLLTALIPNPQININALGSYYSLIFSLRQSDSIIQDITHTSPDGIITITPSRYYESFSQWSQSGAVNTDIVELLSTLVSIPDANGFNTTLSISAGLDSRTLLALMNRQIPGKFTSFCTGSETLPDLTIAENICSEENIPLKKELYIPEEVSDIYTFLREISLRTNMLFKLDNSLFFNSVKNIAENGAVLIDGAFGELLRAMLGNKLLFSGKEKLLHSDSSVFTEFLGKELPVFFSTSAVNELRKGTDEDCENVFRDMPHSTSIPLDRWIDLFIIRYRLAQEDSEFIDSIIPNIMPFAQQSVLSKMLQTPRFKKNHNKINRKIISKFYPRLQKYSLIRNNYHVPYFSCKNNYFSALLYSILKKTQKEHSDDIALRMILLCEKEVRERVESAAFVKCEFYNHSFIRKLCDDVFSAQDRDSASQLLTFLNFDFWQQLCETREFTL